MCPGYNLMSVFFIDLIEYGKPVKTASQDIIYSPSYDFLKIRDQM